MFKYTREAVNKIIDDFKILSKVFKYTSEVVTVTYLIYSLIAKVGNFYANIILLGLFIGYAIFDFVVSDECACYSCSTLFTGDRFVVDEFMLT